MRGNLSLPPKSVTAVACQMEMIAQHSLLIVVTASSGLSDLASIHVAERRTSKVVFDQMLACMTF